MTTSAVDGTAPTPTAPGPAIARLAEMPGVNLMPREIHERRELTRVKALCALAVALVLLLVGGLFGLAHSHVTAARKDLASAKQQQSATQGQVGQLAYVAQTYANVEAAKQQVATALGGEITWSTYLTDLSLSIPPGVWLTNMTVAAASGTSTGTATGTSSSTTSGTSTGSGSGTAASGSAGSSTPASTAALDTVTFTGVALSRDAVARWLESLVKEKGYTDVYVTTTTEAAVNGTPVVNFTSNLTVTQAALSGRYAATTGSSQ